MISILYALFFHEPFTRVAMRYADKSRAGSKTKPLVQHRHGPKIPVTCAILKKTNPGKSRDGVVRFEESKSRRVDRCVTVLDGRIAIAMQTICRMQVVGKFS